MSQACQTGLLPCISCHTVAYGRADQGYARQRGDIRFIYSCNDQGKNGTNRFCVDYRVLNKCTDKDGYPLQTRKKLWAPSSCPVWILSAHIGKSQWRSSRGSLQFLRYQAEDYFSLRVCHSVCIMHRRPVRDL